MTQCNQETLLFQDLGAREVAASFDGGKVTSDGGGLLLREVGAVELAGCNGRYGGAQNDWQSHTSHEHTPWKLESPRFVVYDWLVVHRVAAFERVRMLRVTLC